MTPAALHGPELDAALDWYCARLPGGPPASLAEHAAALGWADFDRFQAALAGAWRRALAAPEAARA